MKNLDKLIYPLALILGLIAIIVPENIVHVSFLFWIVLMIYCIIDIEKRILLMMFTITVFVFGMSRIVIPTYYSNEYIESSLYYSMGLGSDVNNFVAKSCFFALFFALLGFNSVKQQYKYDYKINISTNSVQMLKIRKIAKYLYLLSSILVIYSIYTRFNFVATFGYMDSYIDYNNNLPSFLYKFASTNLLCLYLFLATLPSKKETKPILIIFMLISVFTLFTGARTNFVMSFITLIIYLIVRNRITPNDPWLTKKGKLIILFSLPVLTAIMFIIMLIRGESSTDNISIFDLIINSIYQQGSILEVLGLSYQEAENIPHRFWSFGRIIDSYGNNFIFQLLGIGEAYKSNTVEFALHGHSLANYLTYTYQTQRFLSGGGMGSSFIAEAWLDFGDLGIIFFSYIYGVILAKFFLWSQKNVWLFAISFYMINAIIYSPRSGACDFISDILSPTYLILLICIYVLTKQKSYV